MHSREAPRPPVLPHAHAGLGVHGGRFFGTGDGHLRQEQSPRLLELSEVEPLADLGSTTNLIEVDFFDHV